MPAVRICHPGAENAANGEVHRRTVVVLIQPGGLRRCDARSRSERNFVVRWSVTLSVVRRQPGGQGGTTVLRAEPDRADGNEAVGAARVGAVRELPNLEGDIDEIIDVRPV